MRPRKIHALILLTIPLSVEAALGQTGAPLVERDEKPVALKVATKAPFGEYLVDGNGHAVYMYSRDSKGESRCNELCRQAWPPVRSARPSAESTLDRSKLGTIQTAYAPHVTYNGHPLYYYKLDGNTPATAGQAVYSYDGDWYLLSPDGKPIKEKRARELPQN